MSALRWGIAGAGKISFDFCLALQTLDKKEHSIHAIGARSEERARQLAEKLNIARHYGSYDELFADADIDVVYIGTVNTTHKDLALQALQNGKHVLCEKPVAMNSKDLVEILEKAKEKNLFFMEALWTRLMPAYIEIGDLIANGEIGEIMAVSVSFGNEVIGSVDRIIDPNVGGSVLMDIGIYAVSFIDIAFSGCMPEHVYSAGFLSESGVDLTSGTTFLYPGKRMAQAMVAGNANLPNEGIIIGTKGRIVVKEPFWCPTCVSVNGEMREYPLPATSSQTNYINSAGLRYEADHVRQCILQKKTESDRVSHKTSKRVLSLLEEMISQVKSRTKGEGIEQTL